MSSLKVVLAVRDHPRLRGEKVSYSVYATLPMGSPPLTRGKVIRFILYGIQIRITPAYAGKRVAINGNPDHS